MIINMKDKINIISKSELIFKILYLISVLFAFNGFFAGSRYITLFNYALVVFGCVLLAIRFVNIKRYIKTPFLPLLILFCVSMCLSAVLNIRYGFSESVKSILWTTLQFGLLYALDQNKSIDECKKEFVLLSSIFCIYVFIANIISIGMFFCNYGVFGPYSPSGNIIGFIWGRLWGVYSDPNNGSVLAVASITLSLCAFAKIKRKMLLKSFLLINIFIDYIYIMLSDSRTGFVVAFISVALVLFLILKDNKMKLNVPLKSVLSVVIAVALSFSFIAGSQSIKNGYNALAIKIISASQNDSSSQNDSCSENDSCSQSDSSSENDSSSQNDSSAETPSDRKDPPIITGRDPADTENDISNRRFSLWKSGIEIWKTSPVYGVSQRNIVSYASDNLPKTYMVNNDMGKFDSSHNLFIDILVGQGIIGLAIILAFFTGVAVIIIRSLFLNKQNRDNSTNIYAVASIGILSAFACSSMFVLDVLYLNSVATVMFWIMLGYLMKFTYRRNDSENVSL